MTQQGQGAVSEGRALAVDSCKDDLDAISHEQALIDAHAANLRVVDITKRLNVLSLEITRLRAELDLVRNEGQTIQGQA